MHFKINRLKLHIAIDGWCKEIELSEEGLRNVVDVELDIRKTKTEDVFLSVKMGTALFEGKVPLKVFCDGEDSIVVSVPAIIELETTGYRVGVDIKEVHVGFNVLRTFFRKGAIEPLGSVGQRASKRAS